VEARVLSLVANIAKVNPLLNHPLCVDRVLPSPFAQVTPSPLPLVLDPAYHQRDRTSQKSALLVRRLQSVINDFQLHRSFSRSGSLQCLAVLRVLSACYQLTSERPSLAITSTGARHDLLPKVKPCCSIYCRIPACCAPARASVSRSQFFAASYA